MQLKWKQNVPTVTLETVSSTFQDLEFDGLL